MLTTFGYDTVKLFLPIGHAQAERALLSWSRVRGEVRFENFKARHVKFGLQIEGSLSSLYFGQNVELVTNTTVQDSLDVLSDATGHNVEHAKIYRLDISSTIETEYPPGEYLACLEDRQGRTVHDSFHGTRYMNSNKAENCREQWKVPTFYDKGRESGTEGHLLRLELRLMKGVKSQLKLPMHSLSARDLSRADVFHASAEMWRKDFLRMIGMPKQIGEPATQTMPQPTLPQPTRRSTQTAKDFQKLLIELAISNHSKYVRDMLEQYRKAGMPDSTYYRMLKLIRNVPNDERADRVQELRSKIETTYQTAIPRISK